MASHSKTTEGKEIVADDATTKQILKEMNSQIYEVEHFNFPVEQFLSGVTRIIQGEITKAVDKFTDDLCLDVNRQLSETQILDCKKTALKTFDMIVKLRGEQLRNYFNATGIFHVDDHILLSEDSIQVEYDQKKDEEIDQNIRHLESKSYFCMMMKNKILEVDELHKQVDSFIAQIEE